MNAIVQFNPTQAPAFAVAKAGERSELAKALAGGGNFGRRISIKGGTFRLIDAGKEVARIEERYLDIVLVKAAPKVSRVFYEGKWDPDNMVPPTCWSQNGDVPSDESAEKQATRCAECPQNISGSGQGQSRACRYQQRLAVVLANDQEGDVLQLALPATSIFGKAEGDQRPLQEYARHLDVNKIAPDMVVTRMKFNTDEEFPKVFFKPMRWLTDDEYEGIQAQALTPEAEAAVTMTVAKMDGVVAAPAELAGKAPIAKAKPAPVAQDEDDEPPAPAPKSKQVAPEAEAPAPAPKRTRGPNKPKPAAQEPAEPAEEPEEPALRTPPPKQPVAGNTAKLASVVDAWDDED